MGRAQGQRAAAALTGITSRRHLDEAAIQGLGASAPADGARNRAQRLLDDVRRGDYDLTLVALSRHAGHIDDTPLASELLTQVCLTAAAQVRADAEHRLCAQLAAADRDARTMADRVLLRDDIAFRIESHLRAMLAPGGAPLTGRHVRDLASALGAEVAAEHAAARH